MLETRNGNSYAESCGRHQNRGTYRGQVALGTAATAAIVIDKGEESQNDEEKDEEVRAPVVEGHPAPPLQPPVEKNQTEAVLI